MTRPLFVKHGYRFVRCPDCTHVRLDPLPDPATLADVYARSYEGGLYATFAAAADVRVATARAQVAAVLPHVAPGPWLDVGCSTGALLKAAAAAGIEAEGIELSPTAVETARKEGLEATCVAVEDFAPAGRFACVTAFDVLEHLIDPNDFLGRVASWLLPGGCLTLTVPDIDSVQARLMGRFWYFYAPPFHVHYFRRSTLERLLARHGFRVLHAAPAPKVLTIDYVLAVAPAFLPPLRAPARLLQAAIPADQRSRARHVPVGELLVLATPRA